MPDRPTFLLGLGAMKAGTTWLHDHLAASPQAAPGYRKEWHVLNVTHEPETAVMRSTISRRARRATMPGRSDAGSLLQAAMVQDLTLYPAYFSGLLSGGARLTFDITPGYAELPAELLREVRSWFEPRGIRAAAIFVMRDPVDRIWSQARMMRSRHPGAHPEPSEQIVLDRYRHRHFATRSRYERTLAALADAYPADDTYLGFYETLFTQQSVDAISAFAGIDPRPGAFDVAANASTASKADQPLSEETQRLLARHLAATYEAVARARPDVDLAAIWPSARLL